MRVGGLDDLHVKGSSYAPSFCNLNSDLLDTVHGSLIKCCRWEDERGVSGVDTGLFNVLGHGVNNELSI